MSLPVITLSGTVKDSHRDPAVGSVVFRLTHQVHDAANDIIYLPIDEVAQLDENGHFSIDLVASQGADANPQGVGYKVLHAVKEVRPQPAYVIILDESNGLTQDLSTLPPAGTSADWFYPNGIWVGEEPPGNPDLNALWVNLS